MLSSLEVSRTALTPVRAREEKPLLILDEIHKYPRWRNLLKGFYDTYAEAADTLVTGSARLSVFNVGGDSLMGRYFSYRMHPLSVAELDDPRFDAPNEWPVESRHRWSAGFSVPAARHLERPIHGPVYLPAERGACPISAYAVCVLAPQ